MDSALGVPFFLSSLPLSAFQETSGGMQVTQVTRLRYRWIGNFNPE